MRTSSSRVKAHPGLQGHGGLGPQVEDSAVGSVEQVQTRGTALSPWTTTTTTNNNNNNTTTQTGWLGTNNKAS